MRYQHHPALPPPPSVVTAAEMNNFCFLVALLSKSDIIFEAWVPDSLLLYLYLSIKEQKEGNDEDKEEE